MNRTLAAITAIFAAIVMLAAPCAALTPTVMGTYTPPGIPTTVHVGEYYEVNLRDYLGASYDPYFNAQSGYFLAIGSLSGGPELPSWITHSELNTAGTYPQIKDGQLIFSGTPTTPGSYQISIRFFPGQPANPNFEIVTWTITVPEPPTATEFTIPMLAGDTFSYTASTTVPSTFAITSGTLSKVGLALDGAKISGTAKLGKETVTLTATSNDGGPVRYAAQEITFNVYRPLSLSGSPPSVSWADQAYSTTLTVVDVDPDATGEVTLTLNAAATNAGYKLTKSSETSWTLTRSAAQQSAGSVLVEITASTSAGGIAQSKKMSTTITTYEEVGITSEPGGHRGSPPTTVWLVQDDDPTWTYTPTGVPADVVFSATGLAGGMTFSAGTLTVPTHSTIPQTTVTITAKSSAGGTEQTATQVITVQVWGSLEFTSEPTVSNIVTTIDGRTITASVIADNYDHIVWDMGDGTIYEGVTSVTHTYADDGRYVIRVTVSDDIGREEASVTAVDIGMGGGPGPAPGGDDNGDDDTSVTSLWDSYGWLILLLAGILAIGLYIMYMRHPVILIAGVAMVLAAIAAVRGWL